MLAGSFISDSWVSFSDKRSTHRSSCQQNDKLNYCPSYLKLIQGLKSGAMQIHKHCLIGDSAFVDITGWLISDLKSLCKEYLNAA